MTDYIIRRIAEARENENTLKEFEVKLYEARSNIGTLTSKIGSTYYHGGLDETDLPRRLITQRIEAATNNLDKAYSLIHDAQQQLDYAISESKELYQFSKFPTLALDTEQSSV